MFLRPLRAASFLLQGQCSWLSCLNNRKMRTLCLWWGRLQGWDLNCIHLMVFYDCHHIMGADVLAIGKMWWGSYLTLLTDFFCAFVSKAPGILLLLMMNEADKSDLILAVIWSTEQCVLWLPITCFAVITAVLEQCHKQSCQCLWTFLSCWHAEVCNRCIMSSFSDKH